jgi:tRNA-specific 2-thiouridylase
LPAQPGNIENDHGKVIGTHEGLMYYTIGQRQGLGIGGQKDADDDAWYVLEKDMARNVLIIGQGNTHSHLFSNSLFAHSIYWINGETPTLPYACRAKTRYRQPDQECVIHAQNEGYRVEFTQPQRAVTPGQSVVFYQDDICLGGGIIESTTRAI